MLLLVLAVVGSLFGCGPNCRSSCETLYGSSDGQCDIDVMGAEGDEGAAELIDECEATCDEAMRNTGKVGTYDPNSNADDDATIVNEKQAALWMECVSTTSCENMRKGYCQPHY